MQIIKSGTEFIKVTCAKQFNALGSKKAVFSCTATNYRKAIAIFKRSSRVIDLFVIKLCRFCVCQHDKTAGYFPNNGLEFLIPRSEIKSIN